MIDKERQTLERIKLKQVSLIVWLLIIVKRDWVNDGAVETDSGNKTEEWGEAIKGKRQRLISLKRTYKYCERGWATEVIWWRQEENIGKSKKKQRSPKCRISRELLKPSSVKRIKSWSRSSSRDRPRRSSSNNRERSIERKQRWTGRTKRGVHG